MVENDNTYLVMSYSVMGSFHGCVPDDGPGCVLDGLMDGDEREEDVVM